MALWRALRLSPLDPLMFLMQAATAVAHFVAGIYPVDGRRFSRHRPQGLL
jgi:hypothetical protein